MTALAAAGTAQDWQLGQRQGLFRLQTDAWNSRTVGADAVVN
jgi:hypothetical protein